MQPEHVQRHVYVTARGTLLQSSAQTHGDAELVTGRRPGPTVWSFFPIKARAHSLDQRFPA
jgi:hypothetical protein